MFKDVYKAALGDKAAEYQTVGFLVSSACAEVIADVLLCPWEAVSIVTFMNLDSPRHQLPKIISHCGRLCGYEWLCKTNLDTNSLCVCSP